MPQTSSQKMIEPANTTVFILAAGRGKRMMPLTSRQPKPLLKVGKLSLIEHHIQYLSTLGFKDFVINVAYLGNKIMQALGNGNRWGVRINYSNEQKTGALETAGGIHNALDIINSEHFLCLNADIWTDFDFTELLSYFNKQSEQNASSAIVLVNNPKHNIKGDFCMDKSNRMACRRDTFDTNTPEYKSYTFSGIGLYTKQNFIHLTPGKHALAPLLRNWCDRKTLLGFVFQGQWYDIGTPARLKEINQALCS